MKIIIKEFFKRGLMFAWGGPAVLAIVYFCLFKAGTVTSIEIPKVVLAIVSTVIIAFLGAGFSIVHQIESLPKVIAALIHGMVLYASYLGFYLLNGWIKTSAVLIFSICFAAGFVIIWLAVYLTVKTKVEKMNKMIK
ncbi:MAG: DUF3021 domain-containing protein [Lachnospiraceae bacterium]|nr:DUF3021 domain-containing protein [Lachnospiraceae bacterium]